MSMLSDVSIAGWTVRVVALIVLSCFTIATATIKTPRPPKPLPRELFKFLDFTAFLDERYTLFAVGCWLGVVLLFNPYFFIGSYSQHINGETRVTPYLLPIMSAASILGRIVPGLIADRVGRYAHCEI